MKQLQLLDAAAPPTFRPIHYLGSKLRLVTPIRAILERVEPAGALCDLFSGSGTVALAMSDVRPVIAVDIQEYSRVLCSALLLRTSNSAEVGQEVASSARSAEQALLLREMLVPLIEYEDECIRQATEGDPDSLCDFIENGSLAWFAATGATSASRPLQRALKSVWQDIQRSDLALNRSLITRHFGGSYFSFRQATELDALLSAAQELPWQLRDVALAPILSTASEIVNTVGKHFAQPIRPRDAEGRPKTRLVSRVLRDRPLPVFQTHAEFLERYSQLPASSRAHTVLRTDFEEFLATYSKDIGVFYADPPYTRDHYSRYYHVLETMCLWDEPKLSTSTGRLSKGTTLSRGFYRSDRHQSPFCIKSRAPQAFERMFAGVSRFGAPLVLSYSPFNANTSARPRLMHIDRITQIARQYFRKVETADVGAFAHSKLNLQERNTPINWDAELLILCRP